MRLPAVVDLVSIVCAEYHITTTQLLESLVRRHVRARHDLFWRARQLDPQPSYPEIGRTLGYDAMSVRYGEKSWQRKRGDE